jgi:hypothetical protein
MKRFCAAAGRVQFGQSNLQISVEPKKLFTSNVVRG